MAEFNELFLHKNAWASVGTFENGQILQKIELTEVELTKVCRS